MEQNAIYQTAFVDLAHIIIVHTVRNTVSLAHITVVHTVRNTVGLAHITIAHTVRNTVNLHPQYCEQSTTNITDKLYQTLNKK